MFCSVESCFLPISRCDDMSTPVHAAVFSCNTRLLSELLEAGGDLRLHDDQGRTPRDWAEIGAQEHSVRVCNMTTTHLLIWDVGHGGTTGGHQ